MREQAILALLSERNLQAAAGQCGVSERTLRRWLATDPAFRSSYQAARRTAFEAGIHRIHAITSKAVGTLEGLRDATESPNVRLGAARTILELGFHQRDAEDIIQRLEQIDGVLRPERQTDQRP